MKYDVGDELVLMREGIPYYRFQVEIIEQVREGDFFYRGKLFEVSVVAASQSWKVGDFVTCGDYGDLRLAKAQSRPTRYTRSVLED